MTTNPDQAVLFQGETPGTVWVVTLQQEDGHSYVVGVYDDEEAAEAHRQELRKNGSYYSAVGCGVHRHSVESEFPAGDSR